MDAHLARAFDILSDLVLNPLIDPEELDENRPSSFREIPWLRRRPRKKSTRFLGRRLGKPGLAHSIHRYSGLGLRRRRLLADLATGQLPPRRHHRGGRRSHRPRGADRPGRRRLWPSRHRPGQPPSAGRPLHAAHHRPAPRLGNKTTSSWPSRPWAMPARTASPTPCSPRFWAATCPRGCFQEVREKRGLAYSIYAGVNGLSDTNYRLAQQR